MSRDRIEVPADLPQVDTSLNPDLPSKTFWTLTEAERQAFDDLNVGEDVIDSFVDKLNSHGLGEKRFHDEVELTIRQTTEHQQKIEQQRAEVAAQQHKAQVAAFAGMALQGILANPTLDQTKPFDSVVDLAIDYGRTLAERLAREETVH